MAKTKPPMHVYVTLKKQPIFDNYDNKDAHGRTLPTGYGPPLGFLQPWNHKKSDDKKHVTQREWAYRGYINDFKCREHNGHLWISGWKWENSVKIHVDEEVDPQPMVYDNVPMGGFKIQRSVSRYSTSNKLWRILDPRGFELEISTGCMDELIQAATIFKGGLIDAECVWKSNKNLMVV